MITQEQKRDYLTLSLEELQAKYGRPKDQRSLDTLRRKYSKEYDEGELVSGDADKDKLFSENIELKRQLRKTLGKLDTARDKTAEYIDVLKSTLSELYADILLNPPAARIIQPDVKMRPESAVLVTSDWQLGKRTPSYNTEVCEERIKRLAEKAIALGELHSKIAPIEELHLFLLGDIVEGEGIFPTQAFQLDSSLFAQVGVNGPRILSNLILDLLSFFPKIHITAVIGNHGNLKLTGHVVNPETNMDRLLYQIVKGRFENEPRVTWDIPMGDGERNFYAVADVRGHGFLLMHGDQIRSGVTTFGPSIQRKTLGFIDSIPEQWNSVFIGHHHTPSMFTINKRKVRVNGTTESSNTYAQENLAATGKPEQWMGFVDEKHGVTSEYWVDLS